MLSETEFTPQELEAVAETQERSRLFFPRVGLLALVMLALQWPSPLWPVQAATTLVAAYALFCWTSCFHETAHQTMCRSKRLNITLGRVLGTVMGVPYTVYRESHIRHHAYLNKPADWELWPYSDPRTSTAFRRVFAWLDLIFGFVVSPYIYGRIYFHKDSPLRSSDIRAAIRREYAIIVLFWGTIFATVAWFGAWQGLLRAWVIPHLVAGVFQTGRKFTEHLGLASYDPLLGTRTVLGNNWWTRLCNHMNFDIFIHGPHHRHPRMAPRLLREAMREYQLANPSVVYPVYRSYWRATCSMLPFLFMNPGVGMNAGAPPPAREQSPSLQNFVADVTREVLAEADRQSLYSTGSTGQPASAPSSSAARTGPRKIIQSGGVLQEH